MDFKELLPKLVKVETLEDQFLKELEKCKNNKEVSIVFIPIDNEFKIAFYDSKSKEEITNYIISIDKLSALYTKIKGKFDINLGGIFAVQINNELLKNISKNDQRISIELINKKAKSHLGDFEIVMINEPKKISDDKIALRE
ncbi:MAG: hypothetical protein WC356_05450 [Candidatus Micrarchaeia archaeon]|jgi:hypothetical protein